MNKFYFNLSTKEKKKFREIVNDLIKNRKAQRDIYNKNIIKCLNDTIKRMEEVKQSKYPLSHIQKVNDSCSKYISNFVRGD